jgi:predicted dehydrogenase
LDRLGIGIVGCGGAALSVCRAMDTIPEVRLAATYDRAEANARDLAAPRGGTVHAFLDSLLADPAVDIVYIALPHDQLAGVTERALRAGRHVLVEKPMALDDEQARRLGRLAEEQALRLGVFFPLREASTVMLARRLIAGGAIGEIRAVRVWTIIDKPPSYWQAGSSGRAVDGWRARRDQAGGGVVLMNSVHQIDVIRYVTGLSFARVMAEAATLSADVEVEDTAGAVVRLSNGAILSLAANAHSPGAQDEERIEIDGAFGRLDLPDPFASAPVRLFLRRSWEDHPAETWIDLAPPVRDGYAETLRAFAQAVRTGAAPEAGAADAAAALAVVLAAYESARTGRAVVPRS